MLIIFEGVDYAGKSTLAKDLSELTGIPILDANFNRIKKFDNGADLQEFAAISMGLSYGVAQINNQTDTDLIIDRCYITDYLYSMLNINGERESRSGLMRTFVNVLDKDNVLFIHVSADTGILEERMKKLDDGDIGENKLDSVKTLYNRFFRGVNSKFEVIKVDTSTGERIGMEDVASKIEIMKEEKGE